MGSMPSTRRLLQTLDGLERQQAELRRQEQVASQERAALAARVEALRVGLDGKDGSSALLAATDRLDGLLGSVAALIKVQSPYETAIAAAFGAAADAVAVTGVPAAVDAFDHLKAEDLGRAGLLIGDLVEAEQVSDWPALPSSARYAIEVVDVPDRLAASVQRMLRKVALVEDLAAARRLVAELARCRRRHPVRRCAQCPLRGRRIIGNPNTHRAAVCR